jgi:transcriptional regulator with XRE-family HTH domain
MDHFDSFGMRLRKAQNLRRMDNKTLAEKAHIRPGTVSHWRSGTKHPTFWLLCEVSKVLNVSTDYLCGFTEIVERQ